MSLAPPKTAESERIPAANRRASQRDRARRLAQRGIAATQRPIGVGRGFARAAPLHAAFAGPRPASSPSPLDAPCRQRRGVYVGSTDSVLSGGIAPAPRRSSVRHPAGSAHGVASGYRRFARRRIGSHGADGLSRRAANTGWREGGDYAVQPIPLRPASGGNV